MNKFIASVMIGVLSMLAGPSWAQNIDTNRMKRDIRIMENVLGELFRMQVSGDKNVAFGGFGQLPPRSVRGTYLPGYGVIFMAPQSGFYGRGIRIVEHSGSGSYSFYYDSDEDAGSNEVDQSSVVARITEFLKDYGSTIGQLKPDEHILVIYGSQSGREFDFIRPGLDKDADASKEKLPVISVAAGVNDLNDYRSGKLDDAGIKKKLKVSTSANKEYLDLKVMGNIFETALREQEGEAFRLMGTVDYLMLDNFGALFSLDLRYSAFSKPWREFEEIRKLRDQMHREMEGMAVTMSRREAREKAPGTDSDNTSKEEREQAVSEAYSQLKTDLKQYVVDYGRTLSSLKDDHFVLITVNINGQWENVPDRFDLQIKKSVLAQLDRGKISREDAMKQIVIKEY